MVLFWILFTLLPEKQFFFPEFIVLKTDAFYSQLSPYTLICLLKKKIPEDYSSQEKLTYSIFNVRWTESPGQEISKWRSKFRMALGHHSATYAQATCPPFLLNAHSKSTARPSWCTEIHFSILEEHVLFSLSALQYFIVWYSRTIICHSLDFSFIYYTFCYLLSH